jgi:hypothetical protein
MRLKNTNPTVVYSRNLEEPEAFKMASQVLRRLGENINKHLPNVSDKCSSYGNFLCHQIGNGHRPGSRKIDH